MSWVSYISMRSINRVMKITFLINFEWINSLSETRVMTGALAVGLPSWLAPPLTRMHRLAGLPEAWLLCLPYSQPWSSIPSTIPSFCQSSGTGFRQLPRCLGTCCRRRLPSWLHFVGVVSMGLWRRPKTFARKSCCQWCSN